MYCTVSTVQYQLEVRRWTVTTVMLLLYMDSGNHNVFYIKCTVASVMLHYVDSVLHNVKLTISDQHCALFHG